jgi:hypothetical protein
MSGDNVVLYAATYHDPAAAGADYEALESAVESSGLEIEGSSWSVEMTRARSR